MKTRNSDNCQLSIVSVYFSFCNNILHYSKRFFLITFTRLGSIVWQQLLIIIIIIREILFIIRQKNKYKIFSHAVLFEQNNCLLFCRKTGEMKVHRTSSRGFVCSYQIDWITTFEDENNWGIGSNSTSELFIEEQTRVVKKEKNANNKLINCSCFDILMFFSNMWNLYRWKLYIGICLNRLDFSSVTLLTTNK